MTYDIFKTPAAVHVADFLHSSGPIATPRPPLASCRSVIGRHESRSFRRDLAATIGIDRVGLWVLGGVDGGAASCSLVIGDDRVRYL
jgi:hypothetical protein